jgi:hypothetical protein
MRAEIDARGAYEGPANISREPIAEVVLDEVRSSGCTCRHTAALESRVVSWRSWKAALGCTVFAPLGSTRTIA